MSRARSKTADSAEVKKKGLPRRLNEKIALMKEKEQAQSEAFEQAMQSILEMQQARTGGGSMPSLQAIDAPPYPSFQVIATTEGMHTLTTPPTNTMRERPHSGGPAGRNPGIERTQSCDNYAQSVSPHQFWNTNTEWTECDLSRHKSDSDLQQSLIASGTASTDGQLFYHHQTTPHSLPPHPPTSLFSPTSLAPPTSPRLKISPPYEEQLSSNNKINFRAVSANSLKNSTNNEIQSPVRLGSSVSAALLSPEYGGVVNIGGAPTDMGGGASSLPDLTNIEFSCGLDIPLEEDEDIFSKPNPFYYPQTDIGTSNDATGMISSNDPNCTQAPPNVSLFNMAQSGNMPHPFYPQIPFSKTPDFRISHHAHQQQHSAPLVRKFKNIVPAGSTPGHYGYGSHTPNQQSSNFLSYGSHKMPPNVSITPINGVTPPPAGLPLQSNPLYSLSYVAPPTTLLSPTQPHPLLPKPPPQQQSDLLFSPPSSNHFPSSLTNNIPHYLDPPMSYQKQVLQQKMAGMSFNNNGLPFRSHSEENLITASQKDLSKGGHHEDHLHTQNPFMGNMSNANSVPCVYVESNNVEPCVDQIDSPTTGTGSPSTSASHASSPPLSRPLWLDQSHSMSDYMFHEWPLDGPLGSRGVGGGAQGGPSLSHHKSLTELNKVAADYVMDLSPSSQARAHQLSLPSIVMNDLMTVDDAIIDKGLVDPSGFLPTDFEMEEEVMESLLRDEGFAPFTIGSLQDDEQNEIIMRHDLNF